MLKRIACILGVLGGVVGTIGSAIGQEHGPPQSKPLVLSHVGVIDVAAGRVRPEMTVIIATDRIAAVGPSGRVPTPDNALVVDAKGKFLIPGLWDAHYHLAQEFSANWRYSASMAPVKPNTRWLPIRRSSTIGTAAGTRPVSPWSSFRWD